MSPNNDDIDVNDFIVADSEGPGFRVPSDPGPRPQLPADNDQIIEADFVQSPPQKPKRKASKILTLAITGIFAAGGVASIFVPPQAKVQQVSKAEVPEAAPQPRPELNLPPGLAESSTPGGPGATSNTSPATPAAATASTPDAQPIQPALSSASPAASQPAAAPVAQPMPTQPQAAPVPPAAPATTPALAAPVQKAAADVAPPANNPIAAQIAEAQKLTASPSTAPVPTQPVAAQTVSPAATPAAVPAAAAQPKPAVVATAPAKPIVPAKPATPSQPAPAAVTATAVKPAPAPAAPKPALAAKPPVQATPAAAKPATVAAAPAVKPAVEKAGAEESVKRLITTSAEAFGVQSMQEGMLTLDSRKGTGPVRLQVGDRLPSGEQILRIDARSLTLVTDRSVIRFN